MDKAWENYIRGVTPLGHVRQVNPPIVSKPAVRRSERRHTLDLHGMTVQEAYETTMQHIDGMAKSTVVVTGLTGQIRREFEHWIANHPTVRRSEALNGGGAFRLHRRKR